MIFYGANFRDTSLIEKMGATEMGGYLRKYDEQKSIQVEDGFFQSINDAWSSQQKLCLRPVLQSCKGWIQNVLVGFGSKYLACNGRTKYFF